MATMNKCHQRIAWQNDTEPPINDQNLGQYDGELDTLDDRIITLNTIKAEQSDLLLAFKDVSLNAATGVITFTLFNNTTKTIDTLLEKIAINFDYDDDPTSAHYQSLIITLEDGTVKYIDMSALITQYEFTTSSTVAFTVGNDGSVSANVIDGSITANKLQPNYLADVTAQANAASASATTASEKALVSEGWAVGQQNGQDVDNTSPYYHNNAKFYKDQAQAIASGSISGLSDVTVVNPQDGQLMCFNGTDGQWENRSLLLGHVIKDEDGTAYTQRANLVFVNADIEDDPTNNATIVTTKGGGGASLGDVSGATASVLVRTASLIWTDPTDVVVGGITLAEWAGTLVVRKLGSAPDNRRDGTVIANSTTRNARASIALEDNTLDYDGTYYYRFFPYTTDGKYTNGSSVSVTPAKTAINTVPTPSAVQWNGSSQSPTWSDYDLAELTISGDTSGTNVGTYTAIFTPTRDYKWSDDSASKSVNWTISKMELAVPTESGSLVYDGTAQLPTWSGYDANYMTKTETAQTAVGTYSTTFTLIDTTNTKFVGTNDTSVSVSWAIHDAVVSAPTVTDTSKTYNGSAQSPTISSYDATVIEITGDTETNAGTYTLVMHLKNTNYKWDDTTTADKTVSWSIAKAQGSISISPATLMLDSTTTSDTVAVSFTGDGAVTISSSDTTKATVSPTTLVASGNVTVTSTGVSGSATITAVLAEGTNYLGANATCAVTCSFLPLKTFATATDAELLQMVQAADRGEIDLADDCGWAVGQERQVTFTDNETATLVLMNKGGYSLVTPVLNKQGTVRSTCSFVVGFKNGLATAVPMNSTATNSGSWASSYMRTWCNGNNVYGKLPTSIKSCFKQFTCYTGDYGNPSQISVSQDYLALPSEKELYGSAIYASSAEGQYTSQFTWYETAANRRKLCSSAAYSNYYWLRTPNSAGEYATQFVAVDGTGGMRIANANYNLGASPFGVM